MPRERELPCVAIDYADRGFVVAMSEVVRFHVEGPGGGGLELRDLDRLLGAEAPATRRGAYVVVVRSDGGAPLGFRTRASVRLARARERALFRLPGVLRDAGCSAWVHGVLAGDRASEAGDAPRIWISLQRLARSVERGA